MKKIKNCCQLQLHRMKMKEPVKEETANKWELQTWRKMKKWNPINGMLGNKKKEKWKKNGKWRNMEAKWKEMWIKRREKRNGWRRMFLEEVERRKGGERDDKKREVNRETMPWSIPWLRSINYHVCCSFFLFLTPF